jgi:hypothetical protein
VLRQTKVPRFTLHDGSHNKFLDYPVVTVTLLQHWTDSYLVNQIAPFSFKYFSSFNTRNCMVYECGCEGDGVDAHRPRSSATPEIRDAECWRPGVSTPPSVQSLYLTYQNGIEAKRCLMPRTHHTSATLRLSSVTCVLRTMCVKLANEEDIFVYSTV